MEKQITGFVLKFVLGAVLVALGAIAAFASSSRIVTGTGSGLIDMATKEAVRHLESACSGGQLSNVQTVGVVPDTQWADFVTVSMIATCTTN
jgi:hypothetical protein